MVTVGKLYDNAKAILKAAGIEDYRFEAGCLLEQLFGIRMNKLLINTQITANQNQINQLYEMIERRKNGYPLQYILGEWEFYGLPFKVGEGVLIPRPDTETLVDYVLEYAKEIDSPRIVDLCSGSGCIAVALEKNLYNSQIYAIEKSESALLYLNENIKKNKSSVKSISGDVLDISVSQNFCDLDIIVSNPPYLTEKDMNTLQKEVEFEPKSALYGGKNGLLFYEEITKKWVKSLKKDGMLAFEIGINQHEDVSAILKYYGFSDIQYKRDLAGVIRVIAGFFN